MSNNPYDRGLDKCAANHVPLSPLSFLERTAQIYPDRPSVIHGARRFTWRETYARCRRLASALASRGIGRGDTVAVMLPQASTGKIQKFVLRQQAKSSSAIE